MSEFDFDDEERDPVTSGKAKSPLAYRFRGFLPVVVDVETGGFNAATDALLEIAATTINMDDDGLVYPDQTSFFRIEPFEGANIEAAASGGERRARAGRDLQADPQGHQIGRLQARGAGWPQRVL